MKEYRVTAIMSTPCYLIVQAENAEDAYEKGREADGGNFSAAHAPWAGDWVVARDVEELGECKPYDQIDNNTKFQNDGYKAGSQGTQATGAIET